ncbi:HesA/MoeB/ThiF family protein [Streptomyces thermocarboxydus]
MQERLRNATVLVAGCGSTGGAVVEPLARLGTGRFVLAEPGEYELNNLNRQSATHKDIGRNKAEVAAERIRSVNPSPGSGSTPRASARTRPTRCWTAWTWSSTAWT